MADYSKKNGQGQQGFSKEPKSSDSFQKSHESQKSHKGMSQQQQPSQKNVQGGFEKTPKTSSSSSSEENGFDRNKKSENEF